MKIDELTAFAIERRMNPGEIVTDANFLFAFQSALPRCKFLCSFPTTANVNHVISEHGIEFYAFVIRVRSYAFVIPKSEPAVTYIPRILVMQIVAKEKEFDAAIFLQEIRGITGTAGGILDASGAWLKENTNER